MWGTGMYCSSISLQIRAEVQEKEFYAWSQCRTPLFFKLPNMALFLLLSSMRLVNENGNEQAISLIRFSGSLLRSNSSVLPNSRNRQILHTHAAELSGNKVEWYQGSAYLILTGKFPPFVKHIHLTQSPMGTKSEVSRPNHHPCFGRAACHHYLVQLYVVHFEGGQSEWYSHGSGKSTASSRSTSLNCCLHNLWVDG